MLAKTSAGTRIALELSGNRTPQAVRFHLSDKPVKRPLADCGCSPLYDICRDGSFLGPGAFTADVLIRGSFAMVF
ncbi:hypothetical protein BDD14_6388 [Edaphobacter modestus]|uniref:Uncharacterized protein n=1 Tax=Edaphobacter modestus TaxID=388466 RepID=A0A4Q7XZE8_9BACT|nr:hypothetical protein BDD14_6388 [Edaphobacter modestus]